jgi:hypothetical protein
MRLSLDFNEKEGLQRIVDLRGWGAIQNLFLNKDGTIDTDSAAKFQDELGEWIVDAINEKMQKERINEIKNQLNSFF